MLVLKSLVGHHRTVYSVVKNLRQRIESKSCASQDVTHMQTLAYGEDENPLFFKSLLFYLQDLLELTPKKDVLFIIGDWNAKVGSQETPGVIGKFGLGVWNEAGQRLIEFCQENTLVIANTLFQQHNYAKSVQIIFQSLGHC